MIKKFSWTGRATIISNQTRNEHLGHTLLFEGASTKFEKRYCDDGYLVYFFFYIFANIRKIHIIK